MRTFLALLMAVVTLLTAVLPAAADEPAEETVAYRAKVLTTCCIRDMPESDKRIKQLEKNDWVDVYEYGDTWCRVGFAGKIGWVKTEWLWHFESQDPAQFPTPNMQAMAGVITLSGPQTIAGGEFPGETAETGAIICVSPAQAGGYTMAVWRGEGTLAGDSGEYTAFVPWREAQPGDLIGGFTTFVSEGRHGAKGENRLFNIAEAGRRIDGAVIAAGEEFSFNAYCAPYLKKNGYKKARNVSNDGEGYGGGVCQVSTTLYNAVLPLPLKLTDWEVHRWRGVEYAPQYFDSAVGSYTDLAFVNTAGYDMVLETHISNGVVTVLIRRAGE